MSLTDEKAPYSLYFWMEEFQDNDDWPAVMRTAKELLHLAPNNPEALRYLAEAYFRQGRSQDAYTTALQLTRVNPMSLDGFWILSDLAAQADDLLRSADYIERAARLIPNSDTIWVEVAKANFNLRRLERCLAAANHGLRINPQNIRLLIYKVFCLAGLKTLTGARAAASRLISLGVEAEDLRDTCKELGITGGSLARVMAISNGAEFALPPPPAARVKKVDKRPIYDARSQRAITSGLEVLSDLTSRAEPLTPAQFAIQLEMANDRRAAEEHGEDGIHELEVISRSTPSGKRSEKRRPNRQDGTAQDQGELDFEDIDPVENNSAEYDPEDDVKTANIVYYVYDKYRIHGPYLQRHLRSLFTDGTFSSRNAYIRAENDDDWSSAQEYPILAELLSPAEES